QLAAGVAHEIRSPLTSLKMFLESMEAEMDISPLYDEDLHVAMAQVERMESTINRFLNFARPQDPLFSEFEAGELIKDALLVARPRAMQQETVIATEIADALPLLSGDRKQLGEALLNLIINGLEATMCGSRIAISASMSLQHSPEESSECIKIDVTDSGPGIDSELIPKLFDPFYTTKATGTGLGLSIVYSTIVRHGGQVGVDSRLGQGTTFSLLIPVKARTDV
ncbi:MAG: ATP-binding protein, partial [Syntrophobacteraceae bacterium]